MRRLIYLDSPPMRWMTLKGESYTGTQCQKLIDFFKRTFGISCNFVRCPYLFLEFIGCTKSKLNLDSEGEVNVASSSDPNSFTVEQIQRLDQDLMQAHRQIQKNVKQQLSIQKKYIEERIDLTLKRASTDLFSKKILDNAFGEYIRLFYLDFEKFLEIFVIALSWDIFSTLYSNNLRVLRERQLGYWMQNLYCHQ